MQMQPVCGEGGGSSSPDNAAENGDNRQRVECIRQWALKEKKKIDALTEGINVRLIVHCSAVVSPSPPG